MYYKIILQICIEDIDYAVKEAIPKLLELALTCDTPEYYTALKVANTIISPNECFIEKYKEAWGDDRNISNIIHRLKDYLEIHVKQNIYAVAPNIINFKSMLHSSPIAGRTTIIENKRIELKTLREFLDVEPFKRENHVLSENFDSNLEKRAITFMYYLELSPFLDIFDYVSSNNSEEYSDEIGNL